MTSTLKTAAATDLDVSSLVEGQTADASDVLTPFTGAETNIDEARETLSVSAADTHVKNLEDALVDGTGINWTKTNPGADEKMQAAIDTTVVMTLSGVQTLSNKTVDDSNDIDLGAIDPGNGAGASPGDVLTWGGSAWGPAAAGGGGATPKDITNIVAGENLAERDAVYLKPSDGKWYKIDVSPLPSANLSGIRGIVNESGGFTSGNPGSVRVDGEVSGFTGLTPGGRVYASATAGGYTQTRPSPDLGVGATTAVVVLGWATSASKIMIEPFHKIQYLKRAELIDEDILTVEHHADPLGRTRRASAYVGVSSIGSSLESYASGNQDEDVPLKKQTTATYGADQCTGGTPSASTESSASFSADKAVDDNTSSYWAASTTTGWWKYDFGTTRIIQRVTIQARTSSANQSPKTFTIEGSNNDSDWDVLYTAANETGWTVSQVRTFTFADNITAYRYYRINVTANDGGALLSMAEVQMMEAATFDDGADALAQGFQLGSSESVAAIYLWLKKTGSPTGNLQVKIQSDNSGDPSGSNLGASDTVAVTSLTTSYGWILFTFPTPVALSASTQYHIVLETSGGQSPINFVEWGADGSAPSYADGEMKSNTGSWTAESKDACFDILGEGAQLEEPANGGWSNGGAPRILVRYDDSTGANPDTNTSFMNVSGVTLDVTCTVEI